MTRLSDQFGHSDQFGQFDDSIQIIREPFIPNPDDPVFDMTGWRIERISPVHTSSWFNSDFNMELGPHW